MANTKKQLRQERAATRLDAQLKSGVKKVKEANFAGVLKQVTQPLEQKDIDRIFGERKTLRDRTGK